MQSYKHSTVVCNKNFIRAQTKGAKGRDLVLSNRPICVRMARRWIIENMNKKVLPDPLILKSHTT